MSDETTPGPDLRQKLSEALCMCSHGPTSSHGAYCPAVLADLALSVVQTELDRRDAEIERLTTHLAARDHALKLVGNHAETVKAERDQLKAALAEAADVLREISKAAIVLQPNLDKPYPDAPETTPWAKFMEQPARRAYNLATRIRRELRSDLPAVRAFAAEHDPRQEG